MFDKLRKKCQDPIYSNLLIEFRAVPYVSNYHVLEYRINPNQDLTYLKKFKILGIPFKIKSRYIPIWTKAERFMNGVISYQYDAYDDVHIMPIFISTKNGLEYYKRRYRTMGEFMRVELLQYSEEQFRKYQESRDRYISNMTVWKQSYG